MLTTTISPLYLFKMSTHIQKSPLVLKDVLLTVADRSCRLDTVRSESLSFLARRDIRAIAHFFDFEIIKSHQKRRQAIHTLSSPP